MPGGGVEKFLADRREGFPGDSCNLFDLGDCGPLYHIQRCDGVGFPVTVDNDLAAAVGKTIYVQGNCYKVFAGDVGKPVVTLAGFEGPFDDCDDCETIWTLDDCDEVEDQIITRTDLTAYVGSVVKISGSDVCWEVAESVQLPGDDIDPVAIELEYDNCEDCLDPCELGDKDQTVSALVSGLTTYTSYNRSYSYSNRSVPGTPSSWEFNASSPTGIVKFFWNCSVSNQSIPYPATCDLMLAPGEKAIILDAVGSGQVWAKKTTGFTVNGDGDVVGSDTITGDPCFGGGSAETVNISIG